MLTLKLSAKCKTLEDLIAVLNRASDMISAGCKCTTRNSEGTAAFGFEVNYDDTTGHTRGYRVTRMDASDCDYNSIDFQTGSKHHVGADSQSSYIS